jgi:hypothetical protein
MPGESISRTAAPLGHGDNRQIRQHGSARATVGQPQLERLADSLLLRVGREIGVRAYSSQDRR